MSDFDPTGPRPTGSNAAGPATTMQCPSCGATNPANSSFVSWCAVCSWNVDPDGLAARDGAAKTAVAKPLSFVSRFVIGLMVHGLVLGCLGLGLFVIWSTWFSIVGFVVGLGLVLLGGLLLPHGTHVPDETLRLDQSVEVELYRYVADLAAQHDVAMPTQLGFTESFQNWSGVVGTFRRPAVVYSYPVWQSLTPTELAAFVAIELEVLHARRRSIGRLTEAATQTLATIVSGSQWERPAGAERVHDVSTGRSTAAKFEGHSDRARVANMARKARPERAIFGLTAALLGKLRRGTDAVNQQAVIEAYERVAQRRGPGVVLRLLDIELMTTSLINAGVRARRRDESLLDAIAEYTASFPDHERERRRRESQLRGSGAEGPWPSVAARAAVLPPFETHLPRVRPPTIVSSTVRGTVEVRLFDRLKSV